MSMQYTFYSIDLDSLCEVGEYLLELDKMEMYNLGKTLGLNYVKLKNLADSETFCDDVIAVWLLKEDDMSEAQKVPPTWRNLVKALQSRSVGQNGLANKIARDKGVF